jgi:predicted MPP superfamily phosphohydrolase
LPTAFARIGVPLIDNHRLFLTPAGLRNKPYPGRSICLAGVGDVWEDEVSFKKAIGGISRQIPRIVLSHNPDAAEMMESGCRVDLMLSGHTHGGQVKLPLIGMPFKVTRYGHKYIGGLCHGPMCPVIVSRGVGMSGLPIRLGVPPELGLITLVKANPLGR